jgi:hypothetical protein
MGLGILSELVPQVKRNCLVSDARHWGYYSICGLLLRLRGLYRSEHGLRPWEKAEEKRILEWVGETEARWAEAADEEFSPLMINGREHDPFDSGGINAILNGEGLLYGAGYGIHMKPVFFLSELKSRESIEGYDVYVAGREHARDLSFHPAMLQGSDITARAEITTSLIWDKFEEFRLRKTPGVLHDAFSAYGAGKGSEPGKIEEVAESELRTYIYHEIGEAVEGEKLKPVWPEMLSCTARRKASVFLRAVKDTLADASPRGMLAHIIRNRKAGSLAFYVSFLYGYRVYLSEKVRDAFQELMKTGEWQSVERARSECYGGASGIAHDVMGLFGEHEDPGAFSSRVEEYLNSLHIGG